MDRYWDNQSDFKFGLGFGDMALKRSSHVFVEDGARAEDMQQRAVASAYRSRRGSRSSTKDDKLLNALDLEDVQRNGISIIRETSTIVRSQTGIAMSQELSIAATAVSRGGETTLEHSWAASNEASADWADKTGTRSTSLPNHPTAERLNDLPNVLSTGRPLNFGVVVPGVYRSSYPKPDNYGFVKDLKLKTMVTLVKKEEDDHDFDSFLTENGIRHVVFNIKGTKKEAIPPKMINSILGVILNRQNYPLMLHCNHGKHRTGCVVAVMRKVSGWNLQRVLDEYELYAAPKLRECDVEYISSFQTASLQTLGGMELSRFSSPLQARTFLRTLAFSTFVMMLWLVSGSQMIANQDQ
ncbi:Tyrosine-protein phosphatase SIW14 [Paramyrothecium foliicola]|nr:Tyrosine-protein phosphatase SIW14 [Paramyrothecium foliicola]